MMPGTVAQVVGDFASRDRAGPDVRATIHQPGKHVLHKQSPRP